MRHDEIEAQLSDLERSLTLIAHLTPTNAEVERDRFLSSRHYEPEFHYPTLNLDLDRIVERIRSFPLTSTEEVLRYRRSLEHLYLRAELLRARGTRARAIVLSSELFGTPDPEALTHARELLAQAREDEPEIVPSDVIARDLRAELAHYGLHGWAVDYHPSWYTTHDPTRQTVYVNPHRKFTERDRTRLPSHEIGVHILRGVNHARQNHRLIRRAGSEDYVATEEGLAAYAEELTDTLHPNALRTYAARHLATHHAAIGSSFRETFAELRDADLTPLEAWNTTLRAFRGGCFTRDKAYLEGYQAVKDFALRGGSLSHLYVGKVDLTQVPTIIWLLEKRKIERPHLIPRFLSSTS
ncbi:DUF1704 domain-containing protein [Patescibacteria group bacterium]|jgi:uncharacterized protein (TIGR02421 family)|nr:DUF1704 domain-containing protein [Patescibacteria group bacterium]